MSKLTVKDRKQLLASVIKEKTNNLLTRQQIFSIVSKLNINNQYKVIVTRHKKEFDRYATLCQSKRYQIISDSEDLILDYLGGYSQSGNVLLNQVQFGNMTYIEGHDSRGSHLLDVRDPQYPVYDVDNPCAILVTCNHNYLSYDGEERDFRILYNVYIYIPNN